MGPRGSMGRGWEGGPGWKDVRFGATLRRGWRRGAESHYGWKDLRFGAKLGRG